MSKQSVSKWERSEGYPDITLLPRIAAYYDVTVDDLLGCGEREKREKIAEFEKQLQFFNNQNRMSDFLALCRAMQKEYPNEKSVLSNLATALIHEDMEKNSDEILSIAETLLESGDPDYRYDALRTLTMVYWGQNDYEQAKKYASMAQSSGDLMLFALRGEERLYHCREYFWELCDRMYSYMGYLLDDDPSLTSEERYNSAKLAYDLYHHIFSDGDFGFFHERLSALCCDLARISMTCGEHERALDELEESLAHALRYDDFISIEHTSPLVRGYRYSTTQTGRAGCEGMAAWIHEEMERKEFDPIREHERFYAVGRRLTEIKKVFPEQ